MFLLLVPMPVPMYCIPLIFGYLCEYSMEIEEIKSNEMRGVCAVCLGSES